MKRWFGVLLAALILSLTPYVAAVPGQMPEVQAEEQEAQTEETEETGEQASETEKQTSESADEASEESVSASNTAKAEISETAVTLIKGQSVKLKITGTNSTVKWESSKSTIAKVSSSGKVTARKKGTTTITATVDGVKYKCKVKVVTPSISASKMSLTVGSTKNLKIRGTSEAVTWKSSNKRIASVSRTGKVTAKKAGTATITATVLGKKYKCVVTVTNAASSSAVSSSGSSSDSSSVTSASTVYITKTGGKYHRAGCRYLSKSMIQISRSSAVARGYTACSVCKP